MSFELKEREFPEGNSNYPSCVQFNTAPQSCKGFQKNEIAKALKRRQFLSSWILKKDLFWMWCVFLRTAFSGLHCYKMLCLPNESAVSSAVGAFVISLEKYRTGEARRLGTADRRRISVGFAAALLLSCSSVALHAETSNADLAKEIAELKAQVREMRGIVAAQSVATKRAVKEVKVISGRRGSVTTVTSMPYAIPRDATPVFVTASKQLQFGALTITPGGYFAGESVYRTRTTNSDIGSNFGGFPTPNNPLAHTDEFRPSARATRAALLVEAAITPRFLAAGYSEFDFYSATNTANSNQSNSYTPRIRHLYATLDDNENGYHFLAGQAYSLVTLNSKGITPRNEVTPAVIDNSQTVGSIYARQAQVRLVKDFNKKFWLALSAEESESTFQPGCTTPNTVTTGVAGNNPGAPFTNVTCTGVGTQGNSGQTNFSLNHAPDVIAKAAYETSIAGHDLHLEGFGLYTNLYDRVDTTQANGTVVGANKNTTGYGGGGGFIASLIPRRLDLQGNAMYGRGIGRYGPSQLADATFHSDGSLSTLPEVIALAGVTLHATPSIDLYGYAGIEQGFRSYNQLTTVGTYAGVGSPTVNDTGCFIEGSTACTGSTRRSIELTGGFWDKIYKGSFGEVRVGAQYAYLQRELFNAPGLSSPKVNDQEVFTSFRYYPFQ